MSNIHLEEFNGLKCSRINCNGDAEICIEWDEIIVRCKTCTNSQVIYQVEEDNDDN